MRIRRHFIHAPTLPGIRGSRSPGASSALFLLALSGCAAPSPDTAGFSVVEASIPELQAAMERGELTSRQLGHGVPGPNRAL